MSGAQPERQELVQQWISKAEEDLRAAEHLLELDESCPFGPVCFHAQQCAEKYLKALLVWEQIPFKRVHDIAELVALVPEAKRPSLPLSAQDKLTHYAVAARYPDEEPPLGREESVAVGCPRDSPRGGDLAAARGAASFPVRMNALHEGRILKLERPLPVASGTRVQLRSTSWRKRP